MNKLKIMKYFNQTCFIFTLLSLLLISLPSNATGPSHSEIKIIPLASNENGVVIFKTRLLINKSGRHSLAGREYGWLCASSNGVWEEALHYRLTETDAEDRKKINFYQTEFENRTDLKNPQISLKILMNKYNFNIWKSVDPHTGKGKAVWSLNNICINGKCSKHMIKQKSLKKIVNDQSDGKPVGSIFSYKGLHLFENHNHFDSTDQIGADFPIKNMLHGKDIGFDFYNITGITIINP